MSATVRRTSGVRPEVWPESAVGRPLRTCEEEDLEDLGSKSLRLTEYTRRGRRRWRMAFAGSMALVCLILLLVVALKAHQTTEAAGTTAAAAGAMEYEDS